MYSLWEYLDNVRDQPDPGALFSGLKSALAPLGFDQIVYYVLRPSLDMPKPEDFNTYPHEWQQHYVDRRYPQDDLVFRTAATRVTPFRWDTLIANSEITKRQRRVFDEARDFNIRNGVTVPLHGPGNGFATLTFSGNLTKVQLDEVWKEHETEFTAVGMYTHEAVLRNAERQGAANVTKLTNREQECLVWTAQGKTSWEISQILSISATTVQFHLKNAMKKLGVYSKLHAVVKSIIHGLIIP